MAGWMKEGDLLTLDVYWVDLYKCELSKCKQRGRQHVLEGQREVTQNGAARNFHTSATACDLLCANLDHAAYFCSLIRLSLLFWFLV